MSFLLLLFATVSFAAKDASYQDISDRVKSYELPNGIKVILAPSEKSKTTEIKIKINAGQYSDAEGKSGTAHLLEHYLFTDAKMTEDMTYLEAIREKGGSANAYTGATETAYYATVPHHLGPWIIETFDKILLHKTFQNDLIQKAKGPVMLEIGRPTPLDYLTVLWAKLFSSLADPPNFWETEFSVKFPRRVRNSDRVETDNISGEDVKEFYTQYYRPANMVIFLAGNFNAKSTLQQLKNTFGREPSRAGLSWKDPEPIARIAPYYHSNSTYGTPMVEIGTKVMNVSLEDEMAARVYLDYLAHRLQKEFRNKNGATYTVLDRVSLMKGHGTALLRFESSEEHYRKNLRQVREMIEQEARQGKFTEAMFQEAKALYRTNFELQDQDSSTMMALAERIDGLDEAYPNRTKDLSDYQAFMKLNYASFQESLKKLFNPKMKLEDLDAPPLVFRFEYLMLMVAGFAFFAFLAQKMIAQDFHHDRVRWVRKLSYPPAFILPLFTLAFANYTGLLAITALKRFWINAGLASQHFVISEYLFDLVSLGVLIFSTQLFFAIHARKIMVLGNTIWIKSLGYASSTIDFHEIKSIEMKYPFVVLSSPNTMIHLLYRFQFYDFCFWRPGILITLKNKKCYFIGVKEPKDAFNELTRLVNESKPADGPVAFLEHIKAA